MQKVKALPHCAEDREKDMIIAHNKSQKHIKIEKL